MDWQRNITAASGYLDLGMGQEAWDELDSIPLLRGYGYALD